MDIGIKTFLRDEQLFHAIQGTQANLPDARMIIADDGMMTEEKDSVYSQLERQGHKIITMPFDSGFGKKSNAILNEATDYLLVGSDDFIFDADAAKGIKEMESILNDFQDVDIVSGRVGNRRYEYFFDVRLLKGGRYEIKEIPAVVSDVHRFTEVDLTVNFSLLRTHSLLTFDIDWDNDVKIGGGEHGAFFFDCWMSGLKTVVTPFANINEQQFRMTEQYKHFRRRALSPERPCFDDRGIVKYTLGNGTVDYEYKGEE